MNMLKSLAHGLAATLLPIMLFSFGTLVSAYQVLGSSDPLKNALSESGLYSKVVSQALHSAQKNISADTASEDIPISDPAVQSIINQAIPPETIETQVEKAIDNAYSWAQGGQDGLSFTIDLGDTKTKVADGLANLASERLASIPTCAAGQTGGAEDPLTATCVPAGFDKVAAAEKIRTEITNNPEFLKDASIDATTVKSDDGQTLADKLSALPSIYEQVKLALYLTGALCVICAVTIVFCAGTIRTGLKRVAIISLVVGIVSALLALVAGFVLRQLADNPKLTIGDNADMQQTIVTAIEIFTDTIRNWWIGYGLVLSVVGVATLVALRFTRPPSDQIREIAPTPQELVNGKRPIAEKLANERASQQQPPVAAPISSQVMTQRPATQQQRPGYRPGKKIQ